MSSPLISAAELQALLQAPTGAVLVLDASFDLADPAAGARAHAAGHVPGALHIDLDSDLSAAKTGCNGRHPLPTRETFARRMEALGCNATTTVVAYDGQAGMYAARLWWMLLWIGHAQVRVLDGGLNAWRAAGGQVDSGAVSAAAVGVMSVQAPRVASLDYATLRAGLGSPSAPLVVYARAADRFRGENETLDPVGGHIPGAVNRFFRDNLGANGRFKPAEQLRQEWRAVIGTRAPAELVQQCGSGVTACHNLLALAVAGLPGSALYPGSWSEWCAQPDAPVAVG